MPSSCRVKDLARPRRAQAHHVVFDVGDHVRKTVGRETDALSWPGSRCTASGKRQEKSHTGKFATSQATFSGVAITGIPKLPTGARGLR